MDGEEKQETDNEGLRILATIILGTVFFIAGLEWMFKNEPDPPSRMVGSMVVALAAGFSASALVNYCFRLLDRKKA